MLGHEATAEVAQIQVPLQQWEQYLPGPWSDVYELLLAAEFLERIHIPAAVVFFSPVQSVLLNVSWGLMMASCRFSVFCLAVKMHNFKSHHLAQTQIWARGIKCNT